MGTQTAVLHPIMQALLKSEEFLGRDRVWTPVNATQDRFLSDIFPTETELGNFSAAEIRSWVSWSADELNGILQKEGFGIRLQPFDKNTFGVASILDVLIKWLSRGTKTSLLAENRKEYCAVKLEGVQAFKPNEYPHPVTLIPTETGDMVFITVADAAISQAENGFQLVERIDSIRRQRRMTMPEYKYICFPMVDLCQDADISWLRGMKTFRVFDGMPAKITQALQQTRLKINETGAHLKSAVAASITLECAVVRQGIIIDRPFFLWIMRNGISVPIMYAYIDYPDWKDPGSLEM